MMSMEKRVRTYARHNGQGGPNRSLAEIRLTPRQRRRIQHKINHLMAPFGPRLLEMKA